MVSETPHQLPSLLLIAITGEDDVGVDRTGFVTPPRRSIFRTEQTFTLRCGISTYTHLESEKMVITRVVTLSLWGGILFR